MARYTKYKHNKDGKKYWALQAYLGTDPMTAKPVRVTRRKDEEGLPFLTKKSAQKEANRLTEEFKSRGLNGKQKNTTFHDVYMRWQVDYSKGVRASTLANTERRFRRYILPMFGDTLIEKVNKRLCDEAIKVWQSEDPRDYNRSIGLVRQVLDYAIYNDILRDNPMRNIYIPKARKAKTRTIEFFDKQELLRFLEEADKYGDSNKWGVLFHFLAFTGCRKSEALALTWSDIDFDERTVTFNKTLSKISRFDGDNEVVVNHTTKNGESRIISLDVRTIDRLKDWKKETKRGLVFRADSDGYIHPDLVRTAMRRINKKMKHKKNVTPHGLRHSHCSLLFEAGRTIKEVQTRLGHKSAKVTMDIYTHVTQGKEKEAADAFLEFMEK